MITAAFFDIGEIVQSIKDEVWAWLPWEALTYTAYGAVAVIALGVVSIYLPVPGLRTLSMTVALGIAAFLVGIWKGQSFAEAREKQKERQAAKPVKPTTIRWPWSP